MSPVHARGTPSGHTSDHYARIRFCAFELCSAFCLLKRTNKNSLLHQQPLIRLRPGYTSPNPPPINAHTLARAVRSAHRGQVSRLWGFNEDLGEHRHEVRHLHSGATRQDYIPALQSSGPRPAGRVEWRGVKREMRVMAFQMWIQLPDLHAHTPCPCWKFTPPPIRHLMLPTSARTGSLLHI